MSRFQVIVLGVGDTFSDRHHPTSLLLESSDFKLAIDCPDMYRRVLRDASCSSGRALEAAEIDDVLITHVHGDHMNGLEGLAFFKHFVEKKRLNLHTSPEVRQVIWEQRLRAPMSQLWDGTRMRELGCDDYFATHLLEWSGVSTAGPFSIRVRRTKHHVPTTALLVEVGGKKLGYSADTAFDPELIEFLRPADLIIHETNLGPAHTAYSDLAALPPDLRARMRLIHYPDFLDLDGAAITAAREGDVYDL